MKHYTLPFLLIAFSFPVSAQSKWSVGLVGGVDVSSIQIHKDFELTDQNGNLLLDNVDPSLQLRYGMNVSYRLNEKWILRSGIRINAQGNQESFNFDDFRWGTQHDGQGGFDPSIDPMEPEYVGQALSKYRNYFLEVPLRLNYALNNKPWQWYIEGGVAANVYLKSWSKFIVEGDVIQKESYRDNYSSLRKFTISLDLGFGVNKSLTDQMDLFIQPMFRYYPMRISAAEEYLFKVHYYNFGIELGGTYCFK